MIPLHPRTNPSLSVRSWRFLRRSSATRQVGPGPRAAHPKTRRLLSATRHINSTLSKRLRKREFYTTLHCPYPEKKIIILQMCFFFFFSLPRCSPPAIINYRRGGGHSRVKHHDNVFNNNILLPVIPFSVLNFGRRRKSRVSRRNGEHHNSSR